MSDNELKIAIGIAVILILVLVYYSYGKKSCDLSGVDLEKWENCESKYNWMLVNHSNDPCEAYAQAVKEGWCPKK